MVDFKEKLNSQNLEKGKDPFKIYDSLDRSSEKGPLRPAQQEILDRWFSESLEAKDSIIKLQTGQGKTLIGLLILQTYLNREEGPSLYLCPNNYLAKQTHLQATSFGFDTVLITKEDIPDEFLNNKKILITSISKLFNGLTKFGLKNRSEKVGTIVIDDAHSCVEHIASTFQIIFPANNLPYQKILHLFRGDLEFQGKGTMLDIVSGDPQSLLKIPYWAWIEKLEEVTAIIHGEKDKNDSVKYSWPILRDRLLNCQAFINGKSIQISPYKIPISDFGSYFDAKHRIFMSATIYDDSALIKNLEVSSNAILNPIRLKEEKWSGEKMILIPGLIDAELTREEIIPYFAKPSKKKYGVIAVSNSEKNAKLWEANGGIIVKKNNISESIDNLKRQKFENTFVILNRYDGIDLADELCRILIIDGKPYSENLSDIYLETVIEETSLVITKTAQRIEQGLGRSVRGEKDYSVIILLGNELIKEIRTKTTQNLFSEYTKKQIEIALEIASDASKELKPEESKFKVIEDLILQCINRNEGWKQYYNQEMAKVSHLNKENDKISLVELELEAEKYAEHFNFKSAAIKIQELIDSLTNEKEKAYYIQTLARYTYHFSKNESLNQQISAHKKNRLLLRPKEGMVFEKIEIISQNRIKNIITTLKRYENFNELQLSISLILTNLDFGIKSDKFEKALDDLAKILGFESQRPDKEWKEGPDNLWAISDNQYLLFECKNEVELDRKEIYKGEVEQIDQAIGWFKKNYLGVQMKPFLIIPTLRIPEKLYLDKDVKVIRQGKLNEFKKNIKAFVLEFHNQDFQSLSTEFINKLLTIHNLQKEDLLQKYSEDPKYF
ncbi:DEAD/DEAH box helicase [Leptospira ognonensis]|uniref:DEAD/DEAH box helicase n=1 Tax=Leptospira ognonensis TaxID=2484945 RepID=A0A4R9K2Z8_9LEPT|nr:DEAD/DEAH box helicase family protein [Leptospira ognonensis]TGL58678.1 DEAD/DEAH box helicase [Leptospira ognonensis]